MFQVKNSLDSVFYMGVGGVLIYEVFFLHASSVVMVCEGTRTRGRNALTP